VQPLSVVTLPLFLEHLGFDNVAHCEILNAPEIEVVLLLKAVAPARENVKAIVLGSLPQQEVVEMRIGLVVQVMVVK
jgi:hypothetical protein